MAPFWRGLDDFREDWAEHQIIAAARGLEIPPVDKIPHNLVPRPRNVESSGTSTSNINSLTVPMGPRTMSASSDMTTPNYGSGLSSPTSPAPPRTSSPLKPHKALAAALNLTRNGSSSDMTPREINLPRDPFVNGQPLEVFLYKDGTECPLCLMYYPSYLNRTRCCDQLICSECFVQIKRPDPHYPEHHEQDGTDSPASTDEPTGELIMEPAKCPYCTQTEFGVTYEPPPFRRGLAHAANTSGLGAIGTAMSSSSSLNSYLSPMSPTSPTQANRRRAQSLAANAPGVITTDRVRPDWTTKLAAARAQQRRRAAAADALHHAAFVMGNNEPRGIFGRPSRFSRRSTRDARGAESPGTGVNAQSYDGNGDAPDGMEPGPRVSSGRAGLGRERFDPAHLENLMMAEAIRLSLADEEERQRKADKEARKDAKKREKDERKAAKKHKGDVYGSQAGSSASASSLSLGLAGRRRGNSANNLRIEAGVAAGSASARQNSGMSGQTPTGSSSTDSTPPSNDEDKGKAIDRSDPSGSHPTGRPTTLVPSPIVPSRGSSHLRQMSNASSISSSGVDSVHGSYGGKDMLDATDDRRASGLSLGGRAEEEESVTPSEPLFNFRSLAEMVGVPIDGEMSPGLDGRQSPETKGTDASEAEGEHVEHAEGGTSQPEERSEIEPSNLLIPPGPSTSSGAETDKEIAGVSTPQLIVTPETPAVDVSKQLGHFNASEQPSEVTQ